MRRLAIIVAACAIGLSGCSGCSNLTKALSAVNAPAATAVDDKAVLGLEVAYGAALDTVTQGAKDGRIKGADAARVAAVIRETELARPALHTALKAGNQTDLIAKFNDFKQLIAELGAINGAH